MDKFAAVAKWVIYVAILILPGSMLILPLVIWWQRHRRAPAQV